MHETDGRKALLTLHPQGHEPDPDVYAVLRAMPRDHLPEIYETGRSEGRFFEASEFIEGGALAEFDLPHGVATLSAIAREIGGALHGLSESGVRHRDLRPSTVLIRAREPLDLVVTGFGAATLSQSDLDIVAPIETTRYTAPEAIAGGVAPASDWWSLGIILLERATKGRCFEGVNDHAFLIHVIAGGAPIPADLDPRVELLLRGLLAHDRHERWGWAEVGAWLAGETPAVPAVAKASDSVAARGLVLGGVSHASPKRLAIAAAQSGNWDEALDLLRTGALATWAEEAQIDVQTQAEIAEFQRFEDTSDDLKLAVALKLLNPALPLTVRGEIIGPNWLLDHPEAGYALVTGPIPDILERKGAELWLARLKARAAHVRQRAKQLDVAVDEDQLRVNLLATSKARLAAVWAERRRVLPDTDHVGLIAILERRQTTEEDLILLLSAAVGQFRTAEAIIAEAAEAAGRAGILSFDGASASQWLEQPRREVFLAIEDRLKGFARCGVERVDEWADQFRLERRLPIARALTLLAVEKGRWREPSKSAYVATILDFFAKRITGAVLRGPLTRFVIGKTTPRVDLVELGTERRPAHGLVDHILLRNGLTFDVDPAAFDAPDGPEGRLRTLHSHAMLYRRDTGIDGLYMGFPFLLIQESRGAAKPRIAPILLWPVKVQPELGARGRVTVAFDREREEVRINPAFEPLLGADTTRAWTEIAHELLGRASLTIADVMDAFSARGALDGRALGPVPKRDIEVEVGRDRIAPAAAFFHLAYIGQAVMEDLRQLKGRPVAGTGLETALRVGEPKVTSPATRGPEIERFFTAASDPSQENAVLQARGEPGLLIEGPPGTGKSQTIVNIVADAIGRNRSLLIVCQKQAALDVVRKRLDAEGLAGRIAMVTDVNKDRRPVIGAIREQLDALWATPAGTGGAWRRRRQEVAARIEALEGELDRHHRALHRTDEACDLSYRLILADLIGYEAAQRRPIDTPVLRKSLGTLNVGAVAELQESCGPLARLWLPAKFEGSALDVLRPFNPDGGALQGFAQDLAAFFQAERARGESLASTPAAQRINDPTPFRVWMDQHATRFRALDGPSWSRLARWIGLFPTEGARPGDGLLEAMRGVVVGLDALPAPTGHAAEAVAETLPDAAAAEALAMFEGALRPATFLDKLLLSPWRRRREAERWLLAKALPANAITPAAAALRREVELRPWRRRVAAVRKQLGAEVALNGVVPHDLARGLEAPLHDLDIVRDLADRLASSPAPVPALAMARQGTPEAFDAFVASIEQGYARHEARGLSHAALQELEAWFQPAWIEARRIAIDQDGTNVEALTKVAEARASLAAYQRYRARAAQLDERTSKVFAQLRAVAAQLESVPADELEAEVRRIIGRESRLAWKMRIEAEQPELALDSREVGVKAAALSQADAEMRKLNARLLTEDIDQSKIGPRSKWEDITRLQGQRARRLREFIDRGAELGLMTLRPVWLMNPDVASRLLPLRGGLFDTIVYDEASQMPVEYALPTLYRARNVVVSGDEKQMPPTSFFTSRIENDEADMFDVDEDDETGSEEEREERSQTWNRREIKDCPDLLQLAKSVLPSTTLQIHYRSVYRELIQFSNAAFYLNRLSVPARHPPREIEKARPLEMIRVDGLYQDQVNPAEARRIVDLLADLWLAPAHQRRSIGVVTFNRKQADLIEELLEERAEQDAGFREALAQERDRLEGGEDMGFFVKNVENVQGDERDVILFSSTFGRNAQGTFRRTFGVLGQQGGERRLNVAVTRAKSKIILVTSMPIAMISDLLSTRRKAASPRDHLQAYFEYARALSNGEFETARGLLSRFAGERRHSQRQGQDEMDGFQDSVASFVRGLGFEPTPSEDDGAFGLDFAVVDPRTGLFGFGIECDPPGHELLTHARAREMWRPAVLRRSIPVLHRVSSQGWYQDGERERARLAGALREAFAEGAAA